MNYRFSRRLFLLKLLFLTAACSNNDLSNQKEILTIGLVSYDQGQAAITRYTNFSNYLGEKTKAFIQLEPAFNELRALERINAQAWSLVFAPPGLAAIAISEKQYQPLFTLQNVNNLRSIIVVRQDSPIQNLNELNGKIIALGQRGSATGYYFPLYNLYGLTLAEILFAPTPKTILQWLEQGNVVAGALSREEFNLYRAQFTETQFRVLYIDPHNVPPGVVLIAPTVEQQLREQIRKYMSEAPADLIQDAGYIPRGKVPDYQYMIAVVKRVRAISNYVREKPARLF